MCCFSGGLSGTAMVHVSGTQIFARSEDKVRQFLVYSLKYSSLEDVAMILPLPVPPRSTENAVRFIDLSGYVRFFEDLDQAFPQPSLADFAPASQDPLSRAASPPPPLAVHTVGAFDASFVPTVADFARLDPQFRIRDQVWEQLPKYRDYGFAVFKLRRRGLLARLFDSKLAKVHPMAFSFPRRDPERLFFPTVHIHDGQVHPHAQFDHALYYQPDDSGHANYHRLADGSEVPYRPTPWPQPTDALTDDPSPRVVDLKELARPRPVLEGPERGEFERFANMKRARGVLVHNRPGYRLKLFGERQNHDTLIKLESFQGTTWT